MNARDECAAASTAGPVELRACMIELAVAAAEIEAADMLFDHEIRSRYIFGFARLAWLVTALDCDPRGIDSVATTKKIRLRRSRILYAMSAVGAAISRSPCRSGRCRSFP
ncbi:hypothetical protein QA635_23580 [Bradyrhizobium brasilense]|uniref:hypothetical protein n=1 Tax=Bradyrhizobium brasilense TaxID=1419277 RepID=UPI0024B1039A|nr:hypothetical protein [Bradyrhizobium australafricanum]WFU29586.1 hypothetical protein QA635_23580 [Bradyrhizobium australafricanum]